MNSLSGFQIVAGLNLLQGQGIQPENISNSVNLFNSISTVNNFQTIFTYSNIANISSNSKTALMSLGANSFPHIFGQVPGDFSSNIGFGPLFEIIPPRINYWFGNCLSSSIFLQVLYQAQAYSSQASDLINSATSAQWAGGPSQSITGGLSSLVGNNPSNYPIIGKVFQQLGTLMLMSSPLSGFSSSGCFLQILNSGNDTIGNLHINFFGKKIVDPTTGIIYTIGPNLFNFIINNPVVDSNNFAIVALNPLDALVTQMANEALTATGDLDAVVTFFGINGQSAFVINQWSDCLNLETILGPLATSIIRSTLNVSATNPIPLALLIQTIMSIKGIYNLNSISDLGSIITNINPLPNSNLSGMTTPINSNDFANLQLFVGPGSGANGNPTVADVIGLTNFNEVIANTVQGITPLMSLSLWSNIATDTGNVSNALVHGISSPVFLSNGNSYSNLDFLSSNAAIWINQEAVELSVIAQTQNLNNYFSEYNALAETHNNSLALINKNGINISNIANNTSILTSFPSQLSAMALGNVETTGMDVLLPLISNSSASGQALIAVIIEAQNNQQLNNSGLVPSSFDVSPITIPITQTGTNTIGGGRI